MNKYLISCFSAAIYLTLALSPFQSFARSEYWNQRVSLFDKLPITSADIVFLGNSITDGGEFAELFNDENIKNRGINSDEISGVKERLSQITSGNPKKIFLLIGINDISHNLSVDEIAKRYDSLVKEIKEQTPSTKLYIQSIMPINNDYGRYKNLQGKESIVLKVNERLKSIADENNATFIDLFPALSDREGKLKREYTNDGLHLLGNGYKAWANHIKEYVIE
ncbi:MAG: sialate O-acetylesterase [Muribaculaceae bacterium]|nr:sialate O-acetylesterase [Muribaculaceae bacterium]